MVLSCLVPIESKSRRLTLELSSYKVVGLSPLTVVVHSVETIASFAALQYRQALGNDCLLIAQF